MDDLVVDKIITALHMCQVVGHRSQPSGVRLAKHLPYVEYSHIGPVVNHGISTSK